MDYNQLNNHSWQFYLHPEHAWEAMLEDCASAEICIKYEQYIFSDDAIGRRFLDLFIDKARAGVKVFLLCDAIGSKKLIFSPLIRKLRRSGGIVRFYNRPAKTDIIKPWRWLPRTHTKALLIDNAIAYAGGVCIATRMHDWRDTEIRFTGPVVNEVIRYFHALEKQRPDGAVTPPYMPDTGDKTFKYLSSWERPDRRAISREFIKILSNAKRYIYITTPYFVPHRRIIKILQSATGRGVEVILLLPEWSDVLLADILGRMYYFKLLKSGIRIYQYAASVLHSKTTIVDDNWGTIGSTNFDILSFLYNREANLTTTHNKVIADLKGHFMEDLSRSEEVKTPYFRLPLAMDFRRIFQHE